MVDFVPGKHKLRTPPGHTPMEGHVLWRTADGKLDHCEVKSLEGALEEIRLRFKDHDGKLEWVRIDFDVL
jgi:hypothetical protein